MSARITPAARIPELDGLRGMAIALVVLHHYVGQSLTVQASWADWVRNALLLSWSGVDLFFVLSGYLIGGQILDHHRDENFFSVFWRRRACRIIPVYFAWVVVWLLVVSFLAPAFRSPWGFELFGCYSDAARTHAPAAVYFTFVQNIYASAVGNHGGHWLETTWSLAVEEQFYLIWPVLVWLVSRRRTPWLVGAIILLAPALRLLVHWLAFSHALPQLNLDDSHVDIFIYQMLACRMDSLAIGVLCAVIIRHPRLWPWLCRHKAGFLPGGIALAAVTYWGAYRGGLTIWGYGTLALTYACLLLRVLAGVEAGGRSPFRWRPLCWLGTIAYGTYLFHHGINYLLHGLLLGGDTTNISNLREAVVTLLALGTTLLLAWASWNYFERPIITWSRRLDYKPAR